MEKDKLSEKFSIPKEFSYRMACAPIDKIPEMVVKCIQVLDSTINVEFVSYENLPIYAGAFSDIKQRKILLPKSEYNIETTLKFAFHELAHIWYSTPPSKLPCKLNKKEIWALNLLEDIRVDILFCKRFPEFRFFFLKYYDYHNEEVPQFQSGLLYSLWSPLEGMARVMPACKKLEEIGLIEELRKATILAESTEDLIPAAKRLALNIPPKQK